MFTYKAVSPTATLSDPVVFAPKAKFPMAVTACEVVLAVKAP